MSVLPDPPRDPIAYHDLRDLALLALLVAHGADAELDGREIDALAERLLGLEPALSGDDVIRLVREAAQAYAEVPVAGTDRIVARLGATLPRAVREAAFALLRAVAEADGVMHPMESTLLRHVARAWGIGPAFVAGP